MSEQSSFVLNLRDFARKMVGVERLHSMSKYTAEPPYSRCKCGHEGTSYADQTAHEMAELLAPIELMFSVLTKRALESNDSMESMATQLFMKAIVTRKAGELLDCLFGGGTATIDRTTGEVVMITAEQMGATGG